MSSKIRNILIDLMSAIQAGKIFTTKHPQFNEFVNRSFLNLNPILNDKKNITIGIIDNELAWEDEIFFDLSEKQQSLILYLKDRSIERITIQKGLSKEELRKFIEFLSSPKKEMPLSKDGKLLIPGVRNIKAGKIKSMEEETDISSGDIQKIYQNSAKNVHDSIHSVLNEEEIDVLSLRFNTLNFMENFMGRHQEILSLTSVKDRDLITFVHLLNVSVLAMYISSKLGFTQEDVLDLGIAAIFHDIGKISISLDILHKKGKLDDVEFARIKDHTSLGSRILLNYVDSLGILPAVVAFEHHIRYDLTGYPKVTYARKPHQSSLIVSMCDVYDALAQRRSYKSDFPPNKIYEIMIKEKGGLFDPELLEKFYILMGVWPVGSIVELNDKRIAVVRETNAWDIENPQVEVIEPHTGEIIDLSKRKDQYKIERALNPYNEGTKYLDYI